MAKVVVFGASQWAELAHFYLTHDSPHEVAGFTLDSNHLNGDRFRNLPVVPFDEVDVHFPPEQFAMFIPLSFKKMNHIVRDETCATRDTLVGMNVSITKDTKEYDIYRAATVNPERIRSDQIRSLSHKSKG
jgi:hypothetical protein